MPESIGLSKKEAKVEASSKPSKETSGSWNVSLVGVILALLVSIGFFYQQNNGFAPKIEHVYVTQTVEVEKSIEVTLTETKVSTSIITSTATATTTSVSTTVSTQTKTVQEKNDVAKGDTKMSKREDTSDMINIDFVKEPRMINAVRDENYKMPASDIAQNVIHPLDDGIKENAAMVTLCRNSDLWTLVKTIRDVEDRFNHRYHYDWVFLNEVEFTSEFKTVVTSLVSGKVKFGLIPEEQWSLPDSIDENTLDEVRDEMYDKEVLYGESVSYRHMCRYQAGFLFRHPLLAEYDYYWRVDSDINIFCNIPYDIFKFMRVNKKKYGFILSLIEYETTIPTLWTHIKNFTSLHPEYIHENNLLDFISDDDGDTFNGCHFWTNFEIADLNFFRSKAYQTYFDYLDNTGNFFYERWGDAPVHSIAASLFMDKDEIHFFDGLGFYHPDFLSCPSEESIRLQNACTCEPDKDVTWWTFFFCTRPFFRINDLELPPDVLDI